MAAISFGSVGDIVAICEILVKTVNALSKSHGSAVDYQSLIGELWSLAQALEAVKSLLGREPQLHHRGRLEIALHNCQKCLERELDKIQKFETSLSGAVRNGIFKDVYWKLRWQTHKVIDLEKFSVSVN